MKQVLFHAEGKQRLLIRSIATYLIQLSLLLYVWITFATLGLFILWAVLVIWCTSLLAYKKLPMQRQDVLKNNRWFSFGYIGGLILFQSVLRYFWNTTPAELNAGIDPTVIHASETTGMSVVNMLNSGFFLLTVSVPMSHLLMTFKNIRHANVGKDDVVMKRYRKF